MKDFLKFSLKFYFKIQRQIPLNPTFEINDLTLLEEDFKNANKSSMIHNYLPSKEGMSSHLKKNEYASPTITLCLV